MEWRGFAESVWMPSYRRPLGAMVDAILGAGFVFGGMLEPRPDERFREADPEDYEKLNRMPGFLCLVGRKPGAAGAQMDLAVTRGIVPERHSCSREPL